MKSIVRTLILIAILSAHLSVIAAGSRKPNAAPNSARASAAPAGGSVLLKYQLKAGQALKYATTTTTDFSTTQMGQDIAFTSVANAVVNLNIESVIADRCTLLTDLASYAVSITGAPGMKDTTIAMPELVGKRSRRVITLEGREISTAIVDSVHFADPMKQQFSQGSRNVTRMLMELPDHPIAIGDTFTIAKRDTQEAEGGAVYSDVKLPCTYERDVDTLGKHCAVIRYALSITLAGKMKLQHAIDAELSGEGSGKGFSHFDIAGGQMIANSSSIEMNQQIAITGQQSMMIPQSITTNTKTVLVQ